LKKRCIRCHLGLEKRIETAREAKEEVGADVFVLGGEVRLLNLIGKTSGVSVPYVAILSPINRGCNALKQDAPSVVQQ